MNRRCLSCMTIVSVGDGSRCAACLTQARRGQTPRTNEELGGSGGRWQAIRRQVFDAQGGRCQMCSCSIEETPYEVDHITPRAQFRAAGVTVDNSLANLRALCKPCHREVTAAQRRAGWLLGTARGGGTE
jgi:5-methylcytosine-specific restriction endonuclease McrA